MSNSMPVRLLLGALLVCGLSLSAKANEPAKLSDSWEQWRGPDRLNHSADTGLLDDWNATPPKLLWTASGMGKGYASVSIKDNRLFTTGNLPEGQAVIAVNTDDGKILWKTNLLELNPEHGYPGARCTPSIDGDRLYAIASNGAIFCLSVADGEIIWQKNFEDEWDGKMMSKWGFSESPLIDGDLVLCTPGGKDAMMVALDKTTGKEVWKTSVKDLGEQGKDGAGYSSIVISNAAGVKQYVQLTGRGVIGVRASDGKLLWNYNDVANKVANIPTPIVSGDYVFCSTGYGTGSALLKITKDGDNVNAEEVYFLDAKTMQNHHGGMVLYKDHIYCGHGHNNGFPLCLNLKTGKVVWGGKIRGEGSGSAAVLFADGNLIFRYENGEIALVEATTEDYKLKGSFRPDQVLGKAWAHPVVCGGKLYLREQDVLMCYDLRK
ncbi:PQQ-like beta-propeller repeat protein [Gimesia sp.]|uniref:PQQ-binding-like beta-propeller repeat protein n=1 Tax=Gimesia sp. TaxID=2024833 RepID=UPI0025C18856|nr:PQQ-like beta-propeller repeat protein [Gimesia sp.]